MYHLKQDNHITSALCYILNAITEEHKTSTSKMLENKCLQGDRKRTEIFLPPT